MNSSPSISPRASTFFSGKVSPGSYARPTIGVYEITADKQERLERLRMEFKELDINQDDNLTFEEVREFLKKKSGEDFDEVLCQELFANMDKDKDSGVTVEEFIMSYVQAEELIHTRIEQLERQVTDNQQHLEEAKWKYEQARKTEKTNQHGVMVDSVLTCHVREAKNLKPTNMRGKSDPYAVLTCERQRIETKYIPGEINPVWDEVFTFKIEKKDASLKLNVMDKSTIGQDAFQGQVVIELSSIADQLKHDKYFELYEKDNKTLTQGKVRLGLQWIHSRVKYYETIIQQWEENLDMDRQELEHLRSQLQKLDKPFGHLVEMKALSSIKSGNRLAVQIEGLEFSLNARFDGVVAASLGKNVDWNWVMVICAITYLGLAVLIAFARTDFIDVLFPQVLLCAILYYIWSTKSRSAKEHKVLVVGLLLSEVLDVIWFVSVASVCAMQTWTDTAEAGSGLRGLTLFLSVVCFLVKLPITAVVWKQSMDLSRSGSTLRQYQKDTQIALFMAGLVIMWKMCYTRDKDTVYSSETIKESSDEYIFQRKSRHQMTIRGESRKPERSGKQRSGGKQQVRSKERIRSRQLVRGKDRTHSNCPARNDYSASQKRDKRKGYKQQRRQREENCMECVLAFIGRLLKKL